MVEAEGVADPMLMLIRLLADKPTTAAGGTVLCLIAGFAVGSQRIVRARRPSGTSLAIAGRSALLFRRARAC